MVEQLIKCLQKNSAFDTFLGNFAIAVALWIFLIMGGDTSKIQYISKKVQIFDEMPGLFHPDNTDLWELILSF